MRPTRRAFLCQLGAGAGALALGRGAAAMGRTPLGGKLLLHVPWPTGAIDPHDLRDPAAALFAAAIADPLYGLDGAGNPFPSLAAALPAQEPLGAVVRLREGLRTARGAPLDARDVVASIERARARGAAAVLADVPVAKPHPAQPGAVVFAGIDPGRLARVLASPLCALLPRRYSPTAPDATGAFRADPGPDGLILTRNPNAARGPAFLDAIEVKPAPDLRVSLREFESERDDVGWLGLGLHAGRRGAVKFDLGPVAWVVLTTGPDAGSFGMPGVAQQLADALPPERLAHLGLGPVPRSSGDPAWGGPPAGLCVDEGSAHLVEIAQSVAPILSRPGHEITVEPLSRGELAKRRSRGKITLGLEVVRPVGLGALGALVALATADDPARAKDIVRHPPRIPAGATARSLTTTLRVGVVGELRVTGGVVPEVTLARAAGDGWDLGASSRRPKR